MRATIDKAGRLVIPKPIRDQLGLVPGPVEVSVSGASLSVDLPTGELVERDGFCFLPTGGVALTSGQIRELRLGDQR
ncbi:MAG: AbrB/MazE/SpoVT family DNA-binding domain-containing protein [Bifidobacteriaceae bacterium]|jgi:AbrB family looped-hinge helix DNA binding protein|nr:AbrB/MazE/SpoVT family DNA-binding domain-containing protein [Bifidobacteriaceae bacterium]